jgi:hypothetical protein
MRIYLASNWASKDRLAKMKWDIETLGHEVCSHWLEEDSDQSYESLNFAQRQDYSFRDLGEIVSANLLILDTLEVAASGGREVELGFALGTKTPVWIVGPDRNIFHSIASRRFASWAECLYHISGNFNETV